MHHTRSLLSLSHVRPALPHTCSHAHARYLGDNQLTGSLEALRELEQLTYLYVAWVLAGAVGGVEWYGVVRSGARDC